MAKYPLMIIIDGHSLVYRAFFALPPLSTPSGQQVGAVYGLLRMLFRLVAEHRPEMLVVAFDKGLPSARLELYPDYKAHRPEMPDELRSQFAIAKEILAALGVCVVEQEGYEADDLLGTLAVQAEDQGLSCLLVTGDKDVLQLVTDRVHALVTKRGITDTVRYDAQAVNETYGVSPRQLIDVKALMGDSSDNIPGVRGIGEKTALRLIRDYGDLERVLANAAEMGGRLATLLEEQGDIARVSRQLAVIDTNSPIVLDRQAMALRKPRRDEAVDLLMRHGFRSLVDAVPWQDDSPDQLSLFDGPPPVAAGTVLDDEAAERIAELLSGGSALAITVDREALKPDFVLGLAIGDQQYYVVVTGENLPDVLARIAPGWCRGEAQPVVGHGIKPLIVSLLRSGFAPGPVSFDTELAWYLIDANRSSYPIDDLAASYLGMCIPPLAKGDKDPNRIGSVIALRAQAALGLVCHLGQELKRLQAGELYERVELPLVNVLAEMEAHGITVDRERLVELGREFNEQLAIIERELYSLAGMEFNINSPRQVAEVLFDKLLLTPGKKTRTGYSTDAEVLESLAAIHPVPALILKHRQLAKLRSTYVDGLLSEIDPHSQRVHTQFNQAVTSTGRLSSSRPNLQNIPVRQEVGRQIRTVFVPSSPQRVLLAADYSQSELRVLAHLSQDEALLESFRKDEDIHRRTAAEVFGVKPEGVTPEMRARAKAVNLGIIYGITDFGLARDLNVEQAEAREYIGNYLDRYPGVKQYLDGQIVFARQHGYVTTILGRRRTLPEINSRTVAARKFAERTALNTPVQGSAADIIKLAMLAVAKALRESQLDARLLLQVHDELVLEVDRSCAAPAAELVKSCMETAYPLSVPMKVDVKVGSDWAHMKPIEERD